MTAGATRIERQLEDRDIGLVAADEPMTANATAILTRHTIGSSQVPTEGAYTAAFALSAVGGVLASAAALLVPRRADPRVT